VPVGHALKGEGLSSCLTGLGDALWQQVAADPLMSVNRGGTSLGFTSEPHAERNQIDALNTHVHFVGLRPFACDSRNCASLVLPGFALSPAAHETALRLFCQASPFRLQLTKLRFACFAGLRPFACSSRNCASLVLPGFALSPAAHETALRLFSRLCG